jgi:hypothetical protein
LRFASCAHAGRRFAALVEGDVVRPLKGIAELGHDSPCDVLADPPLSDEHIALTEVTLRPVVPPESDAVDYEAELAFVTAGPLPRHAR